MTTRMDAAGVQVRRVRWAMPWGLALSMVLSTALDAQQPVPTTVRAWHGSWFDTEVTQGKPVAIDAYYSVTAIRREDGQVFVRGANYFEWGGVPSLPPGVGYVDVALGELCVALRSDGHVVHWGYLSPITPRQMPTPGNPWVKVATGGAAVLALCADGTVDAWGNNTSGQCNVPALTTGLQYVDVVGGASHLVGIVSDGTLRAWGGNSFGQTVVPPLPTGRTVTKIAGGTWHTLALLDDGNVLAWGRNTWGQCNVPAPPPGLHYVDIAAGTQHSVALRSDGVLIGWGDNNSGQIDPHAPPPGTQWTQIGAGASHTVALCSDGTVHGWGGGGSGQGLFPLPMAADERYTDVATGGAHFLALRTDGTIEGWGAPFYGRLDVPPLPSGVTYTSLAAGYYNSLALRSDGQLVVWGDNSIGQSNVPPLPPGTSYVDAALEIGHIAAIRSDGVAVAWGANQWGQCNLPALPSGVGYVDVAAADHNFLLLRSDGQVVGSGSNTYLVLNVPPLPPGTEYTDIAASRGFGAAVRSDGTIVSWPPVAPWNGWVDPSPLPPGVHYVQVAGGDLFFVARRSDGEAAFFGMLPLMTPTLVPPAGVGRSYLDVDAGYHTSIGLVGATSRYTTFASGCAGTLAASTLIPRDTPQLGKSMVVQVDQLPLDLAVLVFGWQRLQPAVPLAALGMPGCTLHVSLDAFVPLLGSGGRALHELPIPYLPSLLGVQFHHQAWVLDPAANAFGGVVSAAATGIVGG